MAISKYARVAVSVAFAASIALFPTLPPDMPPQVGRSGPFVGAPFVAFSLPVTAILLWWMLASISREPRRRSSIDIGALSALFLSAFHVTMIVAFTSGQIWLSRMLGVIVGVFLVTTGNEFPRLPINLTWGLRTRHTLRHEDVWKRVHRLAGFIRVGIGVAVCIAALADSPSVPVLIVFGVGIETLVGAIAARVFSKRAAVSS